MTLRLSAEWRDFVVGDLEEEFASRSADSPVAGRAWFAVYTTLDRLESKGFLKSWVGDPTPQRGGRRRKFYALRPAGVAALRQAYRAFTAMADGLQSRLELK